MLVFEQFTDEQEQVQTQESIPKQESEDNREINVLKQLFLMEKINKLKNKLYKSGITISDEINIFLKYADFLPYDVLVDVFPLLLSRLEKQRKHQ